MTQHEARRSPLPEDKGRCAVLVAALAALAAKLALAASTGGTQDMRAWMAFTDGVSQRGPVGVYAIDFPARNVTLYNHPPLVGYLLDAASVLERIGLPIQFTLRAAMGFSDVACALVVFEILRRRKSVPTATAAGITLAASPLLLLVSGYHGNTDPLAMALLWLGAYLLIDRRMGMLGGIAAALALSVKLVPIVALPALAAWLLSRRDDRLLRRAALGFMAVIGSVWGPAMLSQWDNLRRNVLGYGGVADRPWGLVMMADSMNLHTVTTWLVGPGRFGILLVCALVPVLLTRTRPWCGMECVAVAITSFLALSTAFGVQYLAWAAAASIILAPRAALMYNVLSGFFLLAVYADWNHGFDWSGVADGRPLRPIEVIGAWVLWALVAVVVALGTRYVLASTHRSARSCDRDQIQGGVRG